MCSSVCLISVSELITQNTRLLNVLRFQFESGSARKTYGAYTTPTPTPTHPGLAAEALVCVPALCMQVKDSNSRDPSALESQAVMYF